VSPAQAIYNMAVARGYPGKAPTTQAVDSAAKAKLDRLSLLRTS
jgi:hypothetical protein